MIKNIQSTATSLSALIPQFFFDIIARFIPGPIIILSLSIALTSDEPGIFLKMDSTLLDLFTTNKWIIAFIFFFVSYVLSVLFYGLWYFFIDNIKRLTDHGNNHLFKNFISFFGLMVTIKRINNIYIKAIDKGKEYSEQHDFIKLVLPGEGSRISKLEAEIHMSSSLAACFLISFFISIFNYTYDYYLLRIILFLVLFVGMLGSFEYFTSRRDRAVETYAKLLKFKENRDRLDELIQQQKN